MWGISGGEPTAPRCIDGAMLPVMSELGGSTALVVCLNPMADVVSHLASLLVGGNE